MIRGYTKLALRQFRRNHVTSVVNVSGLSLGLATCLVAGLYIKHDFAYKVDLSFITLLSGGLIVIITTLATVSFQALRAALVDPVDSLKAE